MIQLTVTLPAIQVTIGNQVVTGSATVVLPVDTAQIISLLQGMGGAPTPAPLPTQAAPVLVVQQPVLAAPEPAPAPKPDPVAPARAPLVAKTPDPIRAPVEPLRAFNPAWARRKVVPPSGAELNRRLIDEAIRAGRVTKLPPGYAHGAKGPPVPKG